MNNQLLRKYLRVTCFMLVGLCVLNIILFRRDGLDWLLAVVAILAVSCFIYSRPTDKRRGLGWVIAPLTLPLWVVTLYLVYQMILGTYAHFAAKPVPAAMVWQPATGEIAANYDAVVTRYPKSAYPKYFSDIPPQIQEAVEVMDETMTSMMDLQTPRPIEEALSDPEFQAAQRTAEAYLDEQLALLARGPMAPGEKYRSIHAPTVSFLILRQGSMANMARILDLTRQGNLARAQDLYLLKLRGAVHGLEPGNNLVHIMVNISNLMRALELQERFAPELTRGREAEIRAILAQTEGKLEEGFRVTLQTELTFLAQIAPPEFMAEDLPLWSGWTDFELWGEYLGKYVHRREYYWPLVVKRDSLGGMGAWLNTLAEYSKLPLPEALAKMEDHAESLYFETNSGALVHWLRPNPVGRIQLSVSIPSWARAYSRIFIARSMLEAQEYILTWSESPAGSGTGAVPLDPGTRRPFPAQVRVLPQGGEEELILGGGDLSLAEVFRRDEKRLKEFNLTDRAIFVFTAKRGPLLAGEKIPPVPGGGVEVEKVP